MAREFADALDYLHRRFDSHCMFIHRDLKPDNIGFTATGTLKLLDFGLCIALEKGKADGGVYKLTGMWRHYCIFMIIQPRHVYTYLILHTIHMYKYSYIYAYADGVYVHIYAC